ncbi:hypothetical protein B0H14DRAFT_2590018 [Mycena olivaceomarginata]|nr:hypothetical protein B0H14DRAFT_2590018 [Mycena olivaceomarginata]
MPECEWGDISWLGLAPVRQTGQLSFPPGWVDPSWQRQFDILETGGWTGYLEVPTRRAGERSRFRSNFGRCRRWVGNLTYDMSVVRKDNPSNLLNGQERVPRQRVDPSCLDATSSLQMDGQNLSVSSVDPSKKTDGCKL